MKIAAYHGPHGKGDHVTFIKGQDPRAEASVWDRVYVTTLFSFEYRKIGETIDYALKLVGGRADRVFVGGIAASLMTERFKPEARWRGVRFISGLLAQDRTAVGEGRRVLVICDSGGGGCIKKKK